VKIAISQKSLFREIAISRPKKINGVAEKHDFRGIQRKIPQISNFAKNWDLNPPSHGDTAADIAKMFANFFL
jgi:hypothetical protein